MADNEKIRKLTETDPLLSIFFLRLVLGWIFIDAGFYKLFIKGVETIPWAIQWFHSVGIPYPEFNAYFVGIIELVAGIFLLLGLFTRIASGFISVIMFVAILFVHRNVGYHYPLVIFGSGVILLQLGGGMFSLDRIVSKRISP